MSSSRLDQIVKGAPSPSAPVPPPPQPLTPVTAADSPVQTSPSAPPDTPLAPQVSAPQVYLNLLILEASLRAQYLNLRDRRRQNTFFIFLLSSWVTTFSYLLFLRPREDGSGIGGSVYWVVEMAEKVALMGGVVTAILIWGTGQWDRGIRWPRRWLSIANRGLRTLNAKIVIVRGPWWRELLSHFVFLFPYTALFPNAGTSLAPADARLVFEHSDMPLSDEDLTPGGDHIKLLLLPKPFSPDFRENWELYRLEYWEKENDRRAKLRQVVKRRQKELNRQDSRWITWGRSGKSFDSGIGGKAERNHLRPIHETDPLVRHSSIRAGSHSRNASRSSTPSTIDADDRMASSKTRRGSATHPSGERRRKTKSGSATDSSVGQTPALTG